jgi:DNA-directed RNA polymerase subunit E"
MKKICKQCRLFVEENVCPICKNSDFTTSWNGRINVLNGEKSDVAKKLTITANGEYAIKAR